MTIKKTLGGVPCSARCAVFLDECIKCNHQMLYINDQQVYDACKCLNPQYKKGQAIICETAAVVEALGVQFDDEAAPSHGTKPDHSA